MYTQPLCDLDIGSITWNDWHSQLGRRGFYQLIQASCSYVLPLLAENGRTRCLQYLNRLETDWNLSYDMFVRRLSFSECNNKNEMYDIMTLAGKIKKDINECVSPTKMDHVGIYLAGLRKFIRENVPTFEKLGKQKDRTKVSGILYQLTSECGDAKLADMCLMFALKSYVPDNESYCRIGDTISYLLASYRVLQERRTCFGTQLNLSAAHVAVLREDYHALASLPYKEDDLWRAGGLSCMLPVELALFNASVCPSKASVLCFIICGTKTGLLDSVAGPLTWDNDAYSRIRNTRLILTNLLCNGTIQKCAEVILRGSCFFDGVSDDRLLGFAKTIETIDCKSYVSEHKLRTLWQLHQSLHSNVTSFDKQNAVDMLTTSDIDDKKRCQSLHMILSSLEYEGVIDEIRRSLRPQYLHRCGKLADSENAMLVGFTDDRLLLRCGVFRGVFAELSHTASGVCGLISPHCLFNPTDLYTFMSILTMLDTEHCLNSFVLECKDARRQLSGNGWRAKRKQ